MVNLLKDIKLNAYAFHRWPYLIWRYEYQDFKLMYEQDNQLFCYLITGHIQQRFARYVLVLILFTLLILLALSIHSVKTSLHFHHLETRSAVAEKHEKQAISALTKLSGHQVNVDKISHEEFMAMVKSYQIRMQHLENLVTFSREELKRANRALEYGLKAAGLNSEDFSSMRKSIKKRKLSNKLQKSKVESIKKDNASILGLRDLLSKNEELHQIIQAFPKLRPVKYGFRTSRFGIRNHPITHQLNFHEGDDFTPTWDTNAYVVLDGKVESIKRDEGYGLMVVILHSHGVKTLYGHLAKTFVYPHQLVKPGQIVGVIGNTGLSTGRHLHFEVMVSEHKLNPSILMAMAAKAQ